MTRSAFGQRFLRRPPLHDQQDDLAHGIVECLLAQSHTEAACLAQRVMPPKVGRNEPCPCGSGWKYKRCCLSQERRMSKWDYARRYNEAFSQNECLVPEPLKHECDNGIAKAHTVPRNCLKRIARNGHVSSFVTTPHVHPGQAPETGLLHPHRAGVNKASTFSGFCPKHDNDLFAPLEKTPFCATPEQCFLLAYRAFAREYYVKRVAAANVGLLREAAMGQPLREQILAHGLSTGFNAAAHDIEIQKARYDKILEARKFHRVRAYVVEFCRPPSVMCAAAVNPTHDFEGRVLQDLSDLDCRCRVGHAAWGSTVATIHLPATFVARSASPNGSSSKRAISPQTSIARTRYCTVGLVS